MTPKTEKYSVFVTIGGRNVLYGRRTNRSISRVTSVRN